MKHNNYQQKWQKEHPDKIKEYQKKYYYSHLKERRNSAKKYNKEHSETHLARSLKWNKDHPERFNELKKSYRLRHLKRVRKANKKWRESVRGKEWTEKYRKEYHSRPEVKKHYKEYMIKYHLYKREKRAGSPIPEKCPVCKRKPLGDRIKGKGRICVDHCHKTGKIRGWLCDDCNVALGRVDDRIYILKNLIKYLKKNK